MLGLLNYNWQLLFCCIDWLFLGPSSSQTNLVFPDIIDGCTFSYENWALWSLHLCHHCRLIGFLQRWFSLIFNFPQTSTYLVPSLQGRFNQLDEDDATSGGYQHWKQESFTFKKQSVANDAFTTEVTGTIWPGHSCHTTTRKQLVRLRRISHNLKTNIQMKKSHPMKL